MTAAILISVRCYVKPINYFSLFRVPFPSFYPRIFPCGKALTRRRLAKHRQMVSDEDMQREGRPFKEFSGLLLCLLLSLLLHAGCAVLWLLLPAPEKKSPRQPSPPGAASRAIQLLRPDIPEERQPPFAKTNPDEEEAKPDRADFEGARQQRASGETSEQKRTSPDPVPTMNGEEKEEVVTFDQKRQDGDLETSVKSSPPAQPFPPPEVSAASPPQEESPNASPPEHDTPDEASPDKAPKASTDSLLPAPQEENGDMNLTLSPEKSLTAPGAHPPDFTPQKLSHPGRPGIAVPYDPSLASHAQPGFRSHERRSRSTGRFVLGRRPSLNVAATPRGRYEELIYRRIARYWYIACDERRGDIIPGSITVSIRIDKAGRINNMELVNRRGASMIQQSFTFGAIRKASLPPMPPQVQEELVGDLMELIFVFNFD